MKMAVSILAALSAPAAANTAWEDLSALDARVEAISGVAIGQPGGAVAPLDRRLKLAACPQPAAIDAPSNGAIAIRCVPLGWRIRVPLSAGSGNAKSGLELAIRRGNLIELEYDGEGFSASASGIALDDGAAGQPIRVKTSTGVTVTATASGYDRARISP